MCEDIKFATRNCRDIEEVAMVGEHVWEKRMAMICKPFTMLAVKYFDAGEEEAAQQWLAECKFRRNIEGADGDLQASIATYDDILFSLQGETAAAYIQLRTLQRRLELTVNNVKIQKGMLAIAETEFDNLDCSSPRATSGRLISYGCC